MTKNKYIAPTTSVVKIETASLLNATSWTPNNGSDRFGIKEEDPNESYYDDDNNFG